MPNSPEPAGDAVGGCSCQRSRIHGSIVSKSHSGRAKSMSDVEGVGRRQFAGIVHRTESVDVDLGHPGKPAQLTRLGAFPSRRRKLPWIVAMTER
jgi:hypothetical protein